MGYTSVILSLVELKKYEDATESIWLCPASSGSLDHDRHQLQYMVWDWQRCRKSGTKYAGRSAFIPNSIKCAFTTVACNPNNILKGTNTMLMNIAIILIVLWLLGLVTSYTMGGLVHILLVVAIIVVLVRVIQGRRVL